MTRIEFSQEEKLRRLNLWRVVIGLLAVLAIVTAVAAGVVAFAKEKDSWLAMRLPLGLAALLLWMFARCAKSIVSIRGDAFDREQKA
jgi:hypothetical protein